MNDRFWFFKRCPLFDRLTPAESQRLEANSRFRSFAQKEAVYLPGEPGSTVLLLARGRIKIKAVTPDGRESILAFIHEGELFGELAIIDGAARTEFAEAVVPSQVLAVLRDDIVWLMSRRADVAMHVTKLLGFRLRRIENRLRNILFRSNRERVIALLLELMETHGEPRSDGCEIGMRLTHQDLANLIGATRESVTVTLGQLRHEGLIDIHRRRIRLLKPSRMRTEIETAPAKHASRLSTLR